MLFIFSFFKYRGSFFRIFPLQLVPLSSSCPRGRTCTAFWPSSVYPALHLQVKRHRPLRTFLHHTVHLPDRIVSHSVPSCFPIIPISIRTFVTSISFSRAFIIDQVSLSYTFRFKRKLYTLIPGSQKTRL